MPDPRLALIAAVHEQGLSNDGAPYPVVSLEAFFTGNDDYGSLGCNLTEHPGPPAFFETLSAIRKRPEVQDVLVEINEADPEDTIWPFSDRVYVLTSASPSQVQAWLSRLQPSEVSLGWANGAPKAAPELRPGMSVVSAWWD